MFHYGKFIFAAVTMVVALSNARAENAPPPPVIEKIAGKPVTITWSDGRQAELEVSPTISGRAKLAMAISENACEPSQRVVCDYSPGLSVATYRLAWTKHPDAARVGQMVRVGFLPSTDLNNLNEDVSWTRIDNILFPGKFEESPADEMSCPSWNWLGVGATLPSQVSVPSISTEFMLTNPNTMQDENKTITTAANVVWEKIENGSLQFQSVSNWDSYFPVGVNSIFVGDVMKWNLEKSTNVYCDVGFKVDIGLLRVAFGDFVGRSQKGPFTPVIFSTELPKFQGLVNSVLSEQTGIFGSSVVYQ